MSTYVLVHGAWHGAWCWHRITARLEAAGHTVLVPDLAGLGRDTTPAKDVTLARWADDVAALLDAQTEPVVLVGHSRGGLVISEVAERRPDRIKALVYLTAFLLPDGVSLNDEAATHSDSLVGQNVIPNLADASVSVREDGLYETFYGECSAEDVALARTCLRPEPLAPLGTPVRVTAENFGRVRRIYIECLRDRAMTIGAQRAMQQVLPCSDVHVIDTDHSPFFSAPEQLTDILKSM